MVREVNLNNYLPEFMKDYEELKQIISSEGDELQKVINESEIIKNNQFIVTCDKMGISKFEKLLNITPYPSDSLEDRVFRVLSNWNDTIPYSYFVLNQKMEMLCGEDGYKITLNNSEYKILVRVALKSKNNFNDVKKMLDKIIPCNMVIDLDLLYNQYITLRQRTHKELSVHSHYNLRNEVI